MVEHCRACTELKDDILETIELWQYLDRTEEYRRMNGVPADSEFHAYTEKLLTDWEPEIPHLDVVLRAPKG